MAHKTDPLGDRSASVRNPIYILISVIVSAFSLAIALILVGVSYFEPGTSANIEFLVRLDFMFCALFFADFLYRVAFARIRYLWWEYIIDIGSFIPPIGFVSPKLRLLRIVRILRVVAILRKLMVGNVADYTPTAIAIVCLCLSMLFGFVVGFRAIEPDTFKSFLDAFYFTVVTASTVGYGDIYPKSELGRVASLCLIFLGVVSFSCITALLASKISGSSSEIAELKSMQANILKELRALKRNLRKG